MPRIWFVSPVYLDVPSYVILRERIHEVLALEPQLATAEARFVALDDTGGLDPEFARLDDVDDVEVLVPPFNLGHQRGIVYAVRTIARRVDDDDLIVTLDADGEDRPEDIPRLVGPLLEHRELHGHVVMALRTRRRYASARFRVLYFFFRTMFRALTGTTVRTGNFVAVRGWTARRLFLHPAFDLCYSSTILALDMPRHMVGCERGRRIDGTSRMGYSRLAIHAMRMLLPFAERIARRLFVLCVLALAVVVLGALTIVVLKLTGDVTIPHWASYALAAVSALCVLGVGNLVVLFTVFSQSRAISLANLEQIWPPRGPGTHERQPA
jgi:polyisoprenyl-phosphate glycosyltransferase